MLKHKRKKSSKIKGKGCSKCARITSEKVKYAKRQALSKEAKKVQQGTAFFITF